MNVTSRCDTCMHLEAFEAGVFGCTHEEVNDYVDDFRQPPCGGAKWDRRWTEWFEAWEGGE